MRFMMLFFSCLSAILALAGAHAQTAVDAGDDFYGRKYALVIGNANYEHSHELKNPANDATDIAETLQKTGFKPTLVLNADLAAFRLALASFESSLPDGAAVVLFYAGHGVQYQGQNFLLPVGSIAKITRAQDLFTQTIALNEVVQQLSTRRKNITVVILDACRNSPFPSLPEVTSGLSRSTQLRRGPNSPEAVKKAKGGALEGVVIAYSTAPDMTAADGEGRNSPYSKHLKEFLRRPKTSLEAILKLTRIEVTKATRGQQTPWYEASINGEFFPAGRNRIEFDDLLRYFIQYEVKDRRPGQFYMPSWGIDKDFPDPIEWSYRENEKIAFGFEKEKFSSAPYNKSGNVILLLDGKVTPNIWKVTLMGARTFYNSVGLQSGYGFGGVNPRDGLGASKLLKEDISCRKSSGNDGTRVYDIKIPGHEPAWMAEWYTCGYRDCNAEYILFFNENDKRQFGCF